MMRDGRTCRPNSECWKSLSYFLCRNGVLGLVSEKGYSNGGRDIKGVSLKGWRAALCVQPSGGFPPPGSAILSNLARD